MTPTLTLAVEDYEWLEPMIRGDVEPDGIGLDVTTLTSGGECHTGTMDGEFEANAEELRTTIRCAHQQGPTEELFDPETMFLRPDGSPP